MLNLCIHIYIDVVLTMNISGIFKDLLNFIIQFI